MATPAEPFYWSLTDAGAALRGGRISAVELTGTMLARIAAVEPLTRAYECVLHDKAIEAAAQADRELAAGRDRGPLHGLPIALKDIYDMAGVPTTASSPVRANAVADADAAAVERLREAGAVLLGKTVTDEFAYGTVCPPTRNPWNTERIPGGSSGGSGAALAAGQCLGALGSDTAGSIRTPAALNGIAGLKPTFGRVSKRGLVPLAFSVDHPGPMAREVRDLALLLGVIAGYDPRDRTTVDVPVPDYAAVLERGVAGLTLGVPTNYYFPGAHDDVAAAVHAAIAVLREAGATVVDVEIPHVEFAFAAGRLIVRAEAAAYHDAAVRDPSTPYGDNARLAIEAGYFVPAGAYLKAQRARVLIQRGFRDALGRCDALIAPTVPATASPAALFEHAVLGTEAFEAINAHVRWAYPANLAGVPALSVPCGFARDGLPVGCQVIGRPFDEATVLAIGAEYERRTDWHLRRPAL